MNNHTKIIYRSSIFSDVTHKKKMRFDFQVELSSGKEVADIIPNIHEIKNCSGRGVVFTGPAPEGSGFDFFTRFFCPKLNVDEVR
jgi:predicted PhzF superfamily epimerase YddE/YHI9